MPHCKGIACFNIFITLFNLVKSEIKRVVFYLMIFGMSVIELANRCQLWKTTQLIPFLEILNILFINMTTTFIVYEIVPLIIWPKRLELQISILMSFRCKFCCKITTVIYGFELFTDRPSNWSTKALTWSTYKSHTTRNFLIDKITQGTNILLKIQIFWK